MPIWIIHVSFSAAAASFHKTNKNDHFIVIIDNWFDRWLSKTIKTEIRLIEQSRWKCLTWWAFSIILTDKKKTDHLILCARTYIFRRHVCTVQSTFSKFNMQFEIRSEHNHHKSQLDSLNACWITTAYPYLYRNLANACMHWIRWMCVLLQYPIWI